jgi:alkanesulfonate monooxygenase SsuD/methylene tetrahydromethanopterin reductase-like flavin-dependent oxidoreductase (luciferase family)
MVKADGNYHVSLVFRYLDTFPKPPGFPTWPDTLPPATYESVDQLASTGSIAVGDPDEVAKTVQRYADTGADQLSFGMLSSSIPIEICQEAVATFGSHVLPRFDKDPVHSTTRQRQAQLGQ